MVTLFLTFDLVLFGAFTRLTDSGLGCPDWPGCYGSASPLGAKEAIATAQAAMPTGPVTHGKAWIEMVHRYLATGVGGLILVLAVSAWLGRKSYLQQHRVSPWLPTFTLVWVCVQGAFGALTVTMKLFPAIVSLHLLGAYLLLALLTVQVVRNVPGMVAAGGAALGQALGCGRTGHAGVASRIGRLGQHQLRGAGVYGIPHVPRQLVACHGLWWRAGTLAALGREPGWWPHQLPGAHGHSLYPPPAGADHGAVAGTVWRGACVRCRPCASPRAGSAGLLLLQVATGLSNVVLDWPLLAAVLHTGGAGAMLVTLVWTLALAGQPPLNGKTE